MWLFLTYNNKIEEWVIWNHCIKKSKRISWSISAENFTGEKGKGGITTEGTGKQCARDLGMGWKISPSVIISPGEIFILADILEQSVIRHIWITDSSETNRSLTLRIYWNGFWCTISRNATWRFFCIRRISAIRTIDFGSSMRKSKKSIKLLLGDAVLQRSKINPWKYYIKWYMCILLDWLYP